MEIRQADIDHFKRGEYENPRFWSRFGQVPDFRGATVLDVGSGWGSLCVDMALAGAKRVVGLDIKSELVDFARGYVRQNYPQLAGIVEFEDVDLRDYSEGIFDFVISKDSFEHIIELDRMLSEMRKRLKPGGKIYAGFGPLYTSPYGDHDRRREILRPWGVWGRLCALVPWGHLFMESTLIDMNNRYREKKVNSIYDLGLNKMSVTDYRRVFHESGLSIADLRVNRSGDIRSETLSLLARIRFLQDYCIHNVYAILEKPTRGMEGAVWAGGIIMERGPILIGGLSRCGKTLMAALLSSHPNIAISIKGSNVWTCFYRQYGDLSRRDNLERCLAKMLRYRNLLALNPNPERVREEFWQGEPTYARLFAILHMHYAEWLGKPRWGDQSRRLECYADPIFAAYPAAKMIHMIRDPRDRYAAAMARPSYGRGKVGVGTARWLCSVGLAKRNSKRYPNRYKIVRYETLVFQPEETMRDVCVFLNEDYAYRMLVMESTPCFRHVGGNRSGGRDGRGNVSTAFVGCYRQVMSKREIAFMQAYAKRDMVAYNYELDPTPLSPSDRLLLYSVDHPANLARMVGRRVVDAIRLNFPGQMKVKLELQE